MIRKPSIKRLRVSKPIIDPDEDTRSQVQKILVFGRLKKRHAYITRMSVKICDIPIKQGAHYDVANILKFPTDGDAERNLELSDFH